MILEEGSPCLTCTSCDGRPCGLDDDEQCDELADWVETCNGNKSYF
jgi:hypothetical protein